MRHSLCALFCFHSSAHNGGRNNQQQMNNNNDARTFAASGHIWHEGMRCRQNSSRSRRWRDAMALFAMHKRARVGSCRWMPFVFTRTRMRMPALFYIYIYTYIYIWYMYIIIYVHAYGQPTSVDNSDNASSRLKIHCFACVMRECEKDYGILFSIWYNVYLNA